MKHLQITVVTNILYLYLSYVYRPQQRSFAAACI